MRAARLLQMLLLLQNRGRLTSRQLAEELEVATRTVLRDVDAMTEAGLPIIVHQGNRGGIELGFNYRTRLTGLARDEAEALGLILLGARDVIAMLGLDIAAERARNKLIESLPDTPRQHAREMMEKFSVAPLDPPDDPRIGAMAQAVRAGAAVRLRFASDAEQVIHPVAMELDQDGWSVLDAVRGDWVPMSDWGRLNVSGTRFREG